MILERLFCPPFLVLPLNNFVNTNRVTCLEFNCKSGAPTRRECANMLDNAIEVDGTMTDGRGVIVFIIRIEDTDR